MRIVGGKDYYDHGLAYGRDESIVFLRTGSGAPTREWSVDTPGGAPEIVPAERNPGVSDRSSWSDAKTRWTHGRVSYEMESVHVIFCGHYYSGARVKWEPAHWDRLQPGETRDALCGNDTFWDLNSFSKWISARGMRVKEQTRKPTLSLFGRAKRKPFAHYPLKDEERSFIISKGVAVATLDQSEKIRWHNPSRSNVQEECYVWKWNCDTLKDYKFIKVLDPVQAFQELSMWVGGVLPQPGRPMVEITDNAVKIAKHGMDKTSFRRPPENAK